MTKQQAQVSTALDQLARHVTLGAAGQLHFQHGELLGQFVETVDDRLIRHSFILGDPQLRLLAAHQRQRPTVQALALTQQLTRIFQQRRAGLGQARLTATATLEQGDAQVRLEQGNGIAHRRLRLALGAGHRRKRALLRYADKQPQLLQIPLFSHVTYLQKR
ncbi:hypothetical protein D9M71_444150 [compost metagenome]